jgi:hypothetical protein
MLEVLLSCKFAEVDQRYTLADQAVGLVLDDHPALLFAGLWKRRMTGDQSA